MSQVYYFTDNRNSKLRYVDASGIINTATLTGSDTIFNSHGGLAGPWGMTIDPTGRFLYIVDELSECVYQVDIHNNYNVVTIANRGGSSTDPMNFGYGDIYRVAVDSHGNVAISDAISEAIVGVNMNSTPQVMCGVTIPVGQAAWIAGAMLAGSPYFTDYAVAFDAQNNLWTADEGDNVGNGNVVYKVDHATGVLTTVAGNGAATNTGDGGAPGSATLDHPFGTAVDPTTGVIFVIANGVNGGHAPRIRAINPTGSSYTYGGVVVAPNTINTVLTLGTLPPTNAAGNNPWAIVPDGNGNLYVCDVGPRGSGCYIHLLTQAGSYSVIAGSSSGTCGYSGDGGPATSALVGESFGLALVPVLATFCGGMSSPAVGNPLKKGTGKSVHI